MTIIHPFKFNDWRSLVLLGGFMAWAVPVRAQYDPDWASHIRVGATLGLNIKASFKSDGSQNNRPPGVYDNGYVLTDKTGNLDGLTRYFGYDSGVYSPAENTLKFSDTRSFTPDSALSSEHSGEVFPGFEMAYGGNIWYWKRLRIGWDAGIGLIPVKISTSELSTGQVSQVQITYNTTGLRLPPTYHASPDATERSIPFTPSSSVTNSISGATLEGSQTLDVMVCTFRIGPSVYWDFNRHLGMSICAGPALGVMTGKLYYDETIDTGTAVRVKGNVSGTDVVYGGFVTASLMWHLVPNGDLFISGQYMPMGKATISGGGRQASLDMGSAVYVSAGINWPF
jgi:hypothetical protein